MLNHCCSAIGMNVIANDVDQTNNNFSILGLTPYSLEYVVKILTSLHVNESDEIFV